VIFTSLQGSRHGKQQHALRERRSVIGGNASVVYALVECSTASFYDAIAAAIDPATTCCCTDGAEYQGHHQQRGMANNNNAKRPSVIFDN
jgi:hypothetical protein